MAMLPDTRRATERAHVSGSSLFRNACWAREKETMGNRHMQAITNHRREVIMLKLIRRNFVGTASASGNNQNIVIAKMRSGPVAPERRLLPVGEWDKEHAQR